MQKKELLELVKISQKIGKRVDYVQGGGGNISVKLDGELMAIKASGYRLNQVSLEDGFVVVNYEKIRKFYDEVDFNLEKDYEKESMQTALNNTLKINDKNLRPSVEVGFHSILDKYVIHSHSVYANILTCSENGKKIFDDIMKENGYSYIWIPYINPGFSLTLMIKDELSKISISEKEKLPKIIMMENHGLIVTSDSLNDVINLHERVNELIKKSLGITQRYPKIKLIKIEENKFKSKTSFVANFIKQNNVTDEFFDRFPLYPDQLVYLNTNIYNDQGKMKIISSTGEVIYNTSFLEALAMEETLVAYLYVLYQIERLNLGIRIMTQDQTNFIKNWESEAYRKKLLKEAIQ